MAEKMGLIMVYTGNGKGKTTAALGLLLRASGHGAKVFMAQFRKSDPSYGEIQAINKFLPTVTVLQSKRSRLTVAGGFTEEDFIDAQEVFEKGKNALLSKSYDLVIFDELNFAVNCGLISLTDVLAMLAEKPAQVDVVLTGRDASEEIMKIADLVSEVKEIKHHYQAGITAQKGVEY